GETLLIVGAGALVATLVAIWAVAALNGVVSFQDVNRLEPFRVDRWVIAFTTALAAGGVLVFGLLPVRDARGTGLVDGLKASTPGATAGVSNRRLRNTLIVAEVAIAIVLAVAALALTRSASALHDLARGVTIDGVMTAQLALNDPRYDDPDQMVRTMTAIVDRLSRAA